MSTIHTMNEQVISIARKCYPSYNGRKFKVTTREAGMNLNSYWDGGSRTYYTLYRLSTGDKMPVPDNGTMFNSANFKDTPVPCEDVAVVSHRIFLGKDMGIEIYIHPSNAPLLITENQEELSWAQRVVLVATRSLKSSYAGISNYRYYESKSITGITEDEYNEAKAQLQSMGLLNKAGAITIEGRNRVGMESLYSLKREL